MEHQAAQQAFLRSQLEPGESISPSSGWNPLITDRRLLWARQLRVPAGTGDWVSETLDFSQITAWSRGNQHDGRPIIRLEHEPVPRISHLPAHRFLWFRWGDVERAVPRTSTTLYYRRGSDPDFIPLRAALEARSIHKGEAFHERPEGARHERTQTIALIAVRPWSRRRVRFVAHRWMLRLYRGRVAWPLRLLSWLVLAVPAWFISPWLVPGAIGLAELGWMALGQNRWHREQQRQRGFGQ